MEKKLTKLDFIIMGVFVLLYGILSFYNLGDTKVPKTYYSFDNNDDLIIELESIHDVSKMRYYTGYNFGDFSILTSNDGNNYNELTTFKTNSVFEWEDLTINTSLKYIKIIPNGTDNVIGDIQIYSDTGEKLLAHSSQSTVLDELNLVPDEISYMNSTYFDEIYFARSAYEYVNGMDAYEWSHPPLGKLIMAIPILLFGFSPFTYRFMGNIAGILLIPAMYILAKKLFKNRSYAILAAIIMTFDNFHMAHTRMGTVDSFLVLFILLSVIFMHDYLILKKEDSFKQKTKYLLLSGFFIGLAIATKWTGLYAGLGLAIVFFINLYRQYENNIKKLFKDKKIFKKTYIILNLLIILPLMIYYSTIILSSREVSSLYIKIYFLLLITLAIILFYKNNYKDKYLIKLSIICIISFIIIPIIIHILSYILFPNLSYYDGTFNGIIDIIKLMYNYHSTLDATHPFTSKWYSWVVMYKPVWYYAGSYASNRHTSISGIGNPAIWWLFIPSILYTLYKAIKKHDDISLFILIFILSTYMPYIFVGRIMFMYHFFIAVPFVMLGIVNIFKDISTKFKNYDLCLFYIVLVIITFIIFYPVTVGIQVPNEYIDSIKWLNSWTF